MKIKKFILLSLCCLFLLPNVTKPGTSCLGEVIEWDLDDDGQLNDK